MLLSSKAFIAYSSKAVVNITYEFNLNFSEDIETYSVTQLNVEHNQIG